MESKGSLWLDYNACAWVWIPTTMQNPTQKLKRRCFKRNFFCMKDFSAMRTILHSFSHSKLRHVRTFDFFREFWFTWQLRLHFMHQLWMQTLILCRSRERQSSYCQRWLYHWASQFPKHLKCWSGGKCSSGLHFSCLLLPFFWRWSNDITFLLLPLIGTKVPSVPEHDLHI